jgi:uncharacterized protein (TIGR04255 family)
MDTAPGAGGARGTLRPVAAPLPRGRAASNIVAGIRLLPQLRKMAFPRSPRVVYRKNPLNEVICQLRFPPILKIISSEPAAFQEEIRGEYPFYRRDDEPGIPPDMATVLRRLRVAVSSPRVTHRFLNQEEDATATVSLTADFVALSTTAYTRWEEFRREILRVKEALETIYLPAPYTRIGLRYQNVISRNALALEDYTWGDLINPEMLGLLGSPELAQRVHATTTEAEVRLDEVVGAVVKLRHGLGETEDGEDVYLIDADFSTTERRESDDVIRCLDVFHRTAGNLFRWSIRERLHEALDPAPVAD